MTHLKRKNDKTVFQDLGIKVTLKRHQKESFFSMDFNTSKCNSNFLQQIVEIVEKRISDKKSIQTFQQLWRSLVKVHFCELPFWQILKTM